MRLMAICNGLKRTIYVCSGFGLLQNDLKSYENVIG